MKRIRGSLLEATLDACNDVERKVEQSAEAKELETSLGLKFKAIIDCSANPELTRTLLEEVAYIYAEKYNLNLIAIIEMMLTGSYIYEEY